MIALGLCVGGLGILLVAAVLADGIPRSALFALGSAFGWTFATVYLKWADIGVDPLVNAGVAACPVGTAVITVGMVIVDGLAAHLAGGSTKVLVSIAFIGLIGSGLAHFLWWAIVDNIADRNGRTLFAAGAGGRHQRVSADPRRATDD